MDDVIKTMNYIGEKQVSLSEVVMSYEQYGLILQRVKNASEITKEKSYQISEMQKELVTKAVTISNLEKDLEAMSTTITIFKKTMEDYFLAAHREARKEEEVNEKWKTVIRKEKEEVGFLASQLKEYTGLYNSAKVELKLTQTTNSQLREEAEIANSKFEKANQFKEELEKRYREKLNENERIKLRLQSLQKESEENEEKVLRLTGQLKSSEERVAEQNSHIQDLNGELAQARDKTEELAAQISRLEHSLKNAKEESSKYQDQGDQLKRLQDLEKQVEVFKKLIINGPNEKDTRSALAKQFPGRKLNNIPIMDKNYLELLAESKKLAMLESKQQQLMPENPKESVHDSEPMSDHQTDKRNSSVEQRESVEQRSKPASRAPAKNKKQTRKGGTKQNRKMDIEKPPQNTRSLSPESKRASPKKSSGNAGLPGVELTETKFKDCDHQFFRDDCVSCRVFKELAERNASKKSLFPQPRKNFKSEIN